MCVVTTEMGHAWPHSTDQESNIFDRTFAYSPMDRRASPVVRFVKDPPAMQETLVQFLGQEGLLEKG